MSSLRVAACQLNPTVGAIDANVEAIIGSLREAADNGAHLAVFGELAITGYPPEDLLLKVDFVRDAEAGLDRVAAATAGLGIVAIVGAVQRGGEHCYNVYNVAAFCRGGVIEAVHRKRHLPNYAVFDERRWFTPGSTPVPVVDVHGVRVGAVVCEDAWFAAGPLPDAADEGADLLVVVNGSPYASGRINDRLSILAARTAETHRPILYVNQVGGQDELVFDGGSLLMRPDGSVAARAPQFVEHQMILDIDPEAVEDGPLAPELDQVDEVYAALVLGTRDYVDKNGFGDIVIGLSGGIDSSVVAAIAADALGPDRVHGVAMPSRFSSPESEGDASQLASNLGIDFRTIAIEPAHATFLEMLMPELGDALGLAEENLQSRIRGVLLMALSNKLGWLVLTTGNKSEIAVGYSTLYGDTAGGFAVIRDVPKTLVFALAQRYNDGSGTDRIPANVLSKPPSAELRPDQRDDQSLPPYEVLDAILEAYVEDDRSVASIAADGFEPVLVRRVADLVDRSEYKRRQSPLGPRVTSKAFGRDRRVPVTNQYRG